MKNVGLWIDHEKAVIVTVTGANDEIKVIHSNIEEHHRQSGVLTPADDILQRELTGHLNRYYEEVITHICDAKSILVFGPGEAKGELKKRIEKDNLGESIVGIEPADKMTDNQITAKVKEHFTQ